MSSTHNQSFINVVSWLLVLVLVLLQLGYVAFAADTYGVNQTSNDVNGWFEIMGKLAGAERTTVLRDRIMAAWKYVHCLPYVNQNKVRHRSLCTENKGPSRPRRFMFCVR